MPRDINHRTFGLCSVRAQAQAFATPRHTKLRPCDRADAGPCPPQKRPAALALRWFFVEGGRQPAGHQKRNDNQLRGRPRRWQRRGKVEEEKKVRLLFCATSPGTPEIPHKCSSASHNRPGRKGTEMKGKVVRLLTCRGTGAGRGTRPSPPLSGQGRGRRQLWKVGVRTLMRRCRRWLSSAPAATFRLGFRKRAWVRRRSGAYAEASLPSLAIVGARGHILVVFFARMGGRALNAPQISRPPPTRSGRGRGRRRRGRKGCVRQGGVGGAWTSPEAAFRLEFLHARGWVHSETRSGQGS